MDKPEKKKKKDEIAKITVPTGSGNSGTPINASQLQLLKTKIMTCII